MNRNVNINYNYNRQKVKYGFLHLLFDLFMTGITGGLWLIYLFIKFLRTH